MRASFYYEFFDEQGVIQNEMIDVYEGANLIFYAQPSPFITISAKTNTPYTGESNERFVITGSTPSGKVIEQKSKV